MFEQLFKFPIVMIDGDNEERKQAEKQRFGQIPNASDDEEQEYDMVFGEAEYPYWDFIGAEDRWLPSGESLQKALDGRFEACIVRFANVGQLLVPWSKKKFRSEISKFAEEYIASQPQKETGSREIRVLTLSPSDYKKAVGETNEDQGEQE